MTAYEYDKLLHELLTVRDSYAEAYLNAEVTECLLFWCLPPFSCLYVCCCDKINCFTLTVHSNAAVGLKAAVEKRALEPIAGCTMSFKDVPPLDFVPERWMEHII